MSMLKHIKAGGKAHLTIDKGLAPLRLITPTNELKLGKLSTSHTLCNVGDLRWAAPPDQPTRATLSLSWGATLAGLLLSVI